MLLPAVLFGLVTVGFVVPCLIDVAVTPRFGLRRLTKPTWILLIVFFSVFGAAAWLVLGRPDRRGPMFPRYLEDAPFFGPQDALRRHPAGRGFGGPSGLAAHPASAAPARPLGPDDDPEFLEELARRIARGRGAGDGALPARRTGPPARRPSESVQAGVGV